MPILSCKNMELIIGKSKYTKAITLRLESSNTLKYPMWKEPFLILKMDMLIIRLENWEMGLTKMELISRRAMVQETQSKLNFNQKRENSGLDWTNLLLKWLSLLLNLKKEDMWQRLELCMKAVVIVLPYLISKIDFSII